MTARVVVIGAGPAGARCAEQVATRGAGAVTLIGGEPGLPYNRVALSQYLAGDIFERDLVTHDDARLRSLGVLHVPATRIAAIDRMARVVRAEDGREVRYDTLVLALGSSPCRLKLPGAGLRGVLMYRTLADVRTMLAHAARGNGDAVVIGGGLLGLEAASGLARRGLAVTVLHAVDRLMERQLDGAAAAMLGRRLAQQGIALSLPTATVAMEGTDAVAAVRLADGTRIPARLVVMAVGIRPEAALARAAGLVVDRGIVVDDAMRTSDPAIFAVGECAQHGGICCGLAAPALAQAEVAARVIAGEPAAYRAASDATALKVAGAAVWSAGEIDAPESQAIIYDDPDGGEYRKLLLRDDRLVGAMLYGETCDASWYQSLIAAGLPLGALRAALPFGPAFAAPGRQL